MRLSIAVMTGLELGMHFASCLDLEPGCDPHFSFLQFGYMCFYSRTGYSGYTRSELESETFARPAYPAPDEASD